MRAGAFHSRGYTRVCVHAETLGYSGVAIYSRIEPWKCCAASAIPS
jgi:exonuclease III